MAKRVAGWFGLVVVCAMAGGCNKSSTADGQASPIAQDQLPAAVARLICDSFGSCCSTAHFVFDSTNCSGNVAADVKSSFGLSGSSTVQYDAQAAGDCVAQLKASLHCGNVSNEADIPACSRITVGTLAAGQPCMNDGECKAPGRCTGFDNTTGQQLCETPQTGGGAMVVRGGTGATCDMSCNDAADCQDIFAPGPIIGDPSQPATPLVACYRVDGLACSFSASGDPTTRTCQALGALGDTCTSPAGCKDGLFCAGHCTAPHPNGASCTDDTECQSHTCLQDTNTCGSTSVTAQDCANGKP